MCNRMNGAGHLVNPLARKVSFAHATSTVSSKKKLAHDKSQISDLSMVATERTTLRNCRNLISKRIPIVLRCYLLWTILCLTVAPFSAPPTHHFVFLSGLFISLCCFHFLYFLLLASSTSHHLPASSQIVSLSCSFPPPKASPWETIDSLWRGFSWAYVGPHRTAEKRSACTPPALRTCPHNHRSNHSCLTAHHLTA